MSTSYLNKNFFDEIQFSIRYAFHIQNRIKIVKTKYAEKLWQLKLLEKDLQTLQRRYNEMGQTYSSIQDYIDKKDLMMDPEIYDQQHVCKSLRQLYHLIQTVKKSFYGSLRLYERNLLDSI